MVFSSFSFLLIFLPCVFLLSRIFRRSLAAQNALLLVASLFFYAWGEPVFVLYMVLYALANYAIARRMEADAAHKKLWCMVSVILSLGFLGLLKYADFAVSTINGIFGAHFALPHIALPIGISFYTFQTMSYVFDVYRGEVQVQKNFGKLLLYIALFPQLIAGPIVRYRDIEAQIDHRQMHADKTARGIRRFIIGLSKKLLLADMIGAAADILFNLPAAQLNIASAWLGALCYALQIYYDFSGYSDMALGLAQIFGFEFRENFLHPYTANSIQDFWRKWHVSLSSWFREYLYIPLGGNRKGKARTNMNKLLVFFCTGLWHGASWTFVLWGLYHGCFLMLESLYKPEKWKLPLRHIYTMFIVIIGFVLFRADDFSQMAKMLGQMFSGFGFSAQSLSALRIALPPSRIIALIAGLFAVYPWQNRWRTSRGGQFAGYALSYVLLFLCLLQLSATSFHPFIYFRF